MIISLEIAVTALVVRVSQAGFGELRKTIYRATRS